MRGIYENILKKTKKTLCFLQGLVFGRYRGESNSGPDSGKDHPLHRLVRIVFRTFSLRKEKGCVMRHKA